MSDEQLNALFAVYQRAVEDWNVLHSPEAMHRMMTTYTDFYRAFCPEVAR